MKLVSKSPFVKWTGLLMALVIVSLAAGFTKSLFSQTEAPSLTLLNESYRLADQLDEPSRPFYLLTLIQAGARVHAPREKEWSELTFNLSHDVRDPWDRVAVQKNAVIALSSTDVQEAMDLLWKVDRPVPDARGHYPEDVRADAAALVFQRYWDKGVDDRTEEATTIERIRRVSEYLAQTGEYPYEAAAKLIDRMSRDNTHANAINQVFTDGIHFYSEGKLRVENRNDRFLLLTQSARSAGAEPSLLRLAIRSLTNNLKVPNDSNFEAEYRTSQGDVIRFTDQNKSLLFRAFPTIKAVDSDLASQMLTQDRVFEKAAEDNTYISGGVIEFSTTPQEAATLHKRMRQISLLGVVQAMQKKPIEANLLAQTLSDPSLRFDAVSSILPALVQVDAPAAKATYIDHRTQLQEFTEEGTRARALVAQSKAAYYVNPDEFTVMASRAFEQSVDLYDSDYRQRPDLRADLHSGYPELREIVRFATAHNLNWVDRIRLLPNVELRGRLLALAAESLPNPATDNRH